MIYATPDDFDAAWEFFDTNKEWFPHVRKSHVRNRLEWGQVIIQDNVLITQQRYKRTGRIGRDSDVTTKMGDHIIHQIIAKNKGTGEAARVIQEYFDHVNTDVYLTVRAENVPANKFYQKIGMERVGYINWSNGKMKGNVWKKAKGN
tara:strand:- start:47 stop:487 length:441 start_codon:yes stop_codon:yes gene_type:complete